MKSIRFAALILGASLFSAPAMAQDSAVVGTWDTESVTDFGTFASTMTVSEGANGYMIAIVDAPMPAPGGGGPEAAPPPMESTISDVMVEGDSFSFTRNMTTPQGPMELAYTGSVDGDALTGQVVSSFGPIPMTGTRAD